MLTKFYVKMQNMIQSKMQDEEGQGLVEYALIIVLVSIVCVVALQALGVQVTTVFNTITGNLTNANAS
jgi:pilus assembly protein Flp/PilA